MTNNDILAEYVRENYPKIEKSFDFVCYRLGKKLATIGESIKRIGGKYHEKTTEDFTFLTTDDLGGNTIAYGTGEDADTLHDQDSSTQRESEYESQDSLQVDAKQEADSHEAREDLDDSSVQGQDAVCEESSTAQNQGSK